MIVLLFYYRGMGELNLSMFGVIETELSTKHELACPLTHMRLDGCSQLFIYLDGIIRLGCSLSSHDECPDSNRDTQAPYSGSFRIYLEES